MVCFSASKMFSQDSYNTIVVLQDACSDSLRGAMVPQYIHAA